ncbi:MAG: sensor histidine kinase [Leucobacter sp.]
MPLLRRLWAAVPTLLLALQLLCFAAVRGDPADVLPWAWIFESVTVCLLALQLRPAAAIALSIFFSLSVPLSSWLFTGGVSQLVLSNTPLRLSNVVFVVLLIGVRDRLSQLYEAEAETRTAAEQRARSSAEAGERVRFSRFVHDEVLSVLTAAQLFSGKPPPELQADAAGTIRALAVGRRPGSLTGARRVDAQQAVEQLRIRFARLAPTATTVVEVDSAPVDADAVEALGEAAAEAVRNAVRHADAQHISVRLTIRDQSIDISVTDDGTGFEPASVPSERLGIRQSIIARVLEIGGRAEVASAPGRGTEVRLSWTTP